MSDGVTSPHNRYRDVVPCKNWCIGLCRLDNKNRVRLKKDSDDEDYINASWISFGGVSRDYIAAQAPVPTNVEDFWHMIGQHKIKVVVMLCKVVENSVVSC